MIMNQKIKKLIGKSLHLLFYELNLEHHYCLRVYVFFIFAVVYTAVLIGNYEMRKF